VDDVALYNCSKILPTAPGSVMARSHLGGATVTWAAAGTNGGAPIAQYAVFAMTWPTQARRCTSWCRPRPAR